MQVDLYDSRSNCIATIEDAERVEACKDGKHHITKVDGYVVSIPAGYELTIKA